MSARFTSAGGDTSHRFGLLFESLVVRDLRIYARANDATVLHYRDSTEREADACAAIVAHAGYSRRKLLDRIIAAHALVHRATLVTMNADNFSDVVGLEMRVW